MYFQASLPYAPEWACQKSSLGPHRWKQIINKKQSVIYLPGSQRLTMVTAVGNLPLGGWSSTTESEVEFFCGAKNVRPFIIICTKFYCNLLRASEVQTRGRVRANATPSSKSEGK